MVSEAGRKFWSPVNAAELLRETPRRANTRSTRAGRGWLPFQWLRVAFIEAVMRPLVWLLALRAWLGRRSLPSGPLLIVANHVTAYDGPLIQYALPGALRRRIAVAMAGEMLEDYRHFRNPERRRDTRASILPGPLIYFLLTALFNVFPLATAARLPAELCARGQGHGSRLQRDGLPRGHALGGGHAGALPSRHRAAGQAIGSDGVCRLRFAGWAS
jgi:hypothetical protein